MWVTNRFKKDNAALYYTDLTLKSASAGFITKAAFNEMNCERQTEITLLIALGRAAEVPTLVFAGRVQKRKFSTVECLLFSVFSEKISSPQGSYYLGDHGEHVWTNAKCFEFSWYLFSSVQSCCGRSLVSFVSVSCEQKWRKAGEKISEEIFSYGMSQPLLIYFNMHTRTLIWNLN